MHLLFVHLQYIECLKCMLKALSVITSLGTGPGYHARRRKFP